MSLSQILKDINLNKADAAMDPSKGPWETKDGRVGLQRAATERLKHLKIDYRRALMEQVAFIVVTGSGNEAFSKVASNEAFGCFNSNPDSLATELVGKISPSLFGRESTKNLFNLATDYLEAKAVELDLSSYNMVRFDERYNIAVSTPEQLVPLVRTALNEQVGSELVGVNAVNSVVDKAIEMNYTATVTPVLLSTADENFALDLFRNLKTHMGLDGIKRGLTNKVFLVAVGKASKELKASLGVFAVKDANEETVEKTLTAIRSKIVG